MNDPPAAQPARPSAAVAIAIMSLTMMGTFLAAVATDAPRGLPGWILLVLGSVAAGLAAGLAFAGVSTFGTLRIRRSRHWRRLMIFIVPLLGLALLASVTLTVAGLTVATALRPRCAPATQFNVLTYPGGARLYQPVVQAFVDQHTYGDRCPRYAVNVFEAVASEVLTGLDNGWSVKSPDAQLDQAGPGTGDRTPTDPYRLKYPRPDLLLPETTLDYPAASLTRFAAARERLIGQTTWRVLARPGGAGPVPTLRVTASDASRADDLAAWALYRSTGRTVLPTTALTEQRVREVERLAGQRTTELLPSGGSTAGAVQDELALLCWYTHLPADRQQRARALVSEQTWRWLSDAGNDSRPCEVAEPYPQQPDWGAGQDGVPFTVARPAITLNWGSAHGSAPPSAEAAETFQDWLLGSEGQSLLDRRAYLNPVPAGAVAVDPTRRERELAELGTVDALRDRAQPVRRLAILLDRSQSMGTQVGREPEFDQARAAVGGLPGMLARSRDQLGVALFPSRAGDRPDALALAPVDDQSAQKILQYLTAVRPDGPAAALARAVEHGRQVLGGNQNAESADAVIVVTDGLNIDALGARPTDRTRIHIVLLGADCAGRAWPGECTPASGDTVNQVLRQIVEQL